MTDSNATVLFVDDDPAILLTIGDKLRFLGYTVTTAVSAEKALAHLARSQPDLIILDISMPGMGGMGFLKAISNADGTSRYPVLVFTARAALDSFFAGLGVEGFLPKTASPEELIEEVRRITGQRRPATAPAAAATDHGAARYSILLVEDDVAVRDRLLHFFHRNNHVAWSVDRGSAIFKSVLERRPDVIVLKYLLPDMNGPAVAQRLADEEVTRAIPVILYDDSGIHSASASFPHVRLFSATASGAALLDAVSRSVLLPSAGAGAFPP